MKGLHDLRKQSAKKVTDKMGLAPHYRFFTGQIKSLTTAEMLQLPAIPGEPIQNPDGTFKAMLDLDALDGDAVLA